MVTSQYNYVVLARFVSDAEIGGFMVALNITAIITLFVVPVSTVLFPAFSRVEASDRDFLPRVFELAVRYSVLLIVPVSVFVSIYSNELVMLLYGVGFSHAGKYLALYAVLYVVFPLALVVRNYFNGVGLPRETFVMSFLVFLVVLPFSPLLAGVYGVLGVVFSIVLGNCVSVVYGVLRCVRSFGLSFGFGRLFRLYVVSFISGFLVFVVKLFFLDFLFSLFLGGVFFLLFYLTFLGVFKALDCEDLGNLGVMFGRLRFVGWLFRFALRYVGFVGRVKV